LRPEDLGIGRLFESARDAVIVADAETQQIVHWNPAATNIFGYSLSEALDEKLRTPSRPDEQEQVEYADVYQRVGDTHKRELGVLDTGLLFRLAHGPLFGPCTT
jgi:PAS domain S-box-containing protein